MVTRQLRDVTDARSAPAQARTRLVSYVPGDPGYADAVGAWNTNAHQRPARVVVARDAADVRIAVRLARDSGMGVGVEIRQLGGALGRTPGCLHPMGSGVARFSLNVLGVCDTPEMAEAARAHIGRLVEATRPHQTGEVFLNFLEIAPAADRVRAAYPPEDWQRLVALKDTYDPENLFRFNRNIPPSPTRGQQRTT